MESLYVTINGIIVDDNDNNADPPNIMISLFFLSLKNTQNDINKTKNIIVYLYFLQNQCRKSVLLLMYLISR